MTGDGEPLCASGYCDQLAVAAIYVHGPTLPAPQPRLPAMLIRPDHLSSPELAAHNWRCIDCLHHEIDVALGLAAPTCGDVTPT